MTLHRAILRALTAALCLVGACDDSGPPTTVVDPALQAKIDRGRYIVNHVAQCGFCHTQLRDDGTRDVTRLLGGAIQIINIRGTPTPVNIPNLTPDATGIANFSDDQVIAAIREGKRLDPMNGFTRGHPAWIFKNMTDDDVHSVVAYLRSIPAVSQDRAAGPNMNPAATPIDLSTFPMPQGLSGASADSALRGRYLVGAAGLCVFCHTPAGQAGAPFDASKFLAGGRSLDRRSFLYGNIPFGPSVPASIVTANITPDATGVAGWTLDDMRNVFRRGVDKGGNCLCAPTHGSPLAPFAGLTDEDVDDIGTYLLAIPATANPAASKDGDCVVPGFCAN